MKLKAAIIFCCFFLLASFSKSFAQYYFYDDNYYDNPVLFEIGGSIGIMNCLTDIGGKKGIGKKFIKDLNINKTRFAGSVYVSATFNNMIALRLEGSFGEIAGADSVLKSVAASTKGRYERNLSFRSRITDIALTAEFHPLLVFRGKNNDRAISRLSPYLVAGIGYFSFNPEAKLKNNWIALQPLRTEGQGFKEYPDRTPYKLKQVCVPVGAGGRFELSQMFNLRAEIIYRILQTDYLDDVSTSYIDADLFAIYLSPNRAAQAALLHSRRYELEPGYTQNVGGIRGYPQNNDGYFTFNLKLGMILGRQRIKKY